MVLCAPLVYYSLVNVNCGLACGGAHSLCVTVITFWLFMWLDVIPFHFRSFGRLRLIESACALTNPSYVEQIISYHYAVGSPQNLLRFVCTSHTIIRYQTPTPTPARGLAIVTSRAQSNPLCSDFRRSGPMKAVAGAAAFSPPVQAPFSDMALVAVQRVITQHRRRHPNWWAYSHARRRRSGSRSHSRFAVCFIRSGLEELMDDQEHWMVSMCVNHTAL